MKRTLIKTALTAVLICTLICGFSLSASAEASAGSEDTTFFGEAFAEIKEHSAEILSALAFAGSAVLTFTYKRGMIPTLKNGIGAMGNIVTDIKESQGSLENAYGELKRELDKRIEGIEKSGKIIENFLEKSKKALEKLDTGAAEREKFAAIMGEQVSLLYDVFMFSSIPEYQKDAIGRRVETMRKLISEDEVNTNEEQADI